MTFIPPQKRFRLFFDETGNGDLNAAASQPNERYLSVTAIGMRQDHHDNYVTRRLSKLKEDFFGRTENSPIVLHRRDIMRREGVFAVLRNESLKAEFDARLLAIIAECCSVAFTVSIDKLEHLNRYKVWQASPYHYVLTCLVERYVMWLERQSAVGDIMGEARSPTHDGQLRRSYRRFFEQGNQYFPSKRLRTSLTSAELKLVTKKADVAGVQLADILAHPAHRALKFKHLGEVLPDDFGALMAKVIERRSYDKNENGGIAGYGTKWLP